MIETNSQCLCLSEKDCGSLNAPANGNIDASQGTKHLAILRYSCDSGYDLMGVITRRCYDGTWEGSQPTCQSKWFFIDREAGAIIRLVACVYSSVCVFVRALLFELFDL